MRNGRGGTRHPNTTASSVYYKPWRKLEEKEREKRSNKNAPVSISPSSPEQIFLDKESPCVCARDVVDVVVVVAAAMAYRLPARKRRRPRKNHERAQQKGEGGGLILVCAVCRGYDVYM